MKKCGFNFSLLFITIFLISLFCCGDVFGKYQVSDTKNLDLDILASYKVKYNANGGTIIYPTAVDDVWLEVEDDYVTKKLIKGRNNELEPEIVKKGYYSSALFLSEYTPLEYIENTSTSYINTGYTLKSQKVKFELVFSQTSVSGHQSLFGAETVAPRKFTGVLYNSSPSLFIGTSEGIGVNLGGLDYTGKKMTLTLATDGNNKFEVTYGDKKSNGSYSGKLCSEHEIYLLNNNIHNSKSTEQICKAKVYSFKVYDNDELVRDMVPCLNKDNEPGMLDLVYGVFYKNAGGGSFSYKEGSSSIIEVLSNGDMEINMKWIPNTYSLNIDYSDNVGSSGVNGKIGNSIKMIYDDTFPKLPSVSRFGYEFDKWLEGEDEFIKPEILNRDEDISIKASWIPINAKLMFNPNGGTITRADDDGLLEGEDNVLYKEVTFDEVIGDLPIPQKEGYEFLGWSFLDGYERLEYIQSEQNKNQWIDTGYMIQSEKVRYELTFSQNNQTHGNQSLFGAETGGTRHFTGVPYGIAGSLYIGTSTSLSVTPNLNNTGKKCTYILETDGNGKYTVSYDGKTYTGSYSSTLCHSVPVGLLNNGGATSQYCYATLYSFKMYDGDELVRDMVPVRQTDGDHKVGMYDIKNKHFYGSKSSNDFVAGPTIDDVNIIDSSYIFRENTDISVVAIWNEISE